MGAVVNAQKRIAAIHDLSGFGKCSLTVALPIISATGVECACIPTALLSTHTGVFKNWTLKDLSDQIVPIASHWNSLGLEFDGIYSGYLASPEQGELLSEAIDLLKGENTKVIIDPAMAENGKHYSNLDERMTECFGKLISKADIITPNITEACFLSGMEYKSGIQDLNSIEKMVEILLSKGPKMVAVTGVNIDEGHVAVVAGSSETGQIHISKSNNYEGTFHGAGDIFASCFSAMVVRGADIQTGLDTAVNFVAECIEQTSKRGTPTHYGMDFESLLPSYISKVSDIFD